MIHFKYILRDFYYPRESVQFIEFNDYTLSFCLNLCNKQKHEYKYDQKHEYERNKIRILNKNK